MKQAILSVMARISSSHLFITAIYSSQSSPYHCNLFTTAIRSS
ncbi:hypothetical protein YpsIP31758_0846 [Yersinia pseudotuberculosis IP 31758]|uniref:Uncharacterized protein n=1 Tax=Yersinia pseudotuberculosis serotype O:1b (strain IP 31758) TaxID=349747 RepID=A0A0U1QUK4_YERP3|nr:hypothetical protein YpsIP31758_0846 [Yersinia pseudotuberculosis IP 31758]